MIKTQKDAKKAITKIHGDLDNYALRKGWNPSSLYQILRGRFSRASERWSEQTKTIMTTLESEFDITPESLRIRK